MSRDWDEWLRIKTSLRKEVGKDGLVLMVEKAEPTDEFNWKYSCNYEYHNGGGGSNFEVGDTDKMIAYLQRAVENYTPEKVGFYSEFEEIKKTDIFKQLTSLGDWM